MPEITPAWIALGAQDYADSMAIAAYHSGGGMHKDAQDDAGNWYPLCVVLGTPAEQPAPYVMTRNITLVDCPKCLEWLHA